MSWSLYLMGTPQGVLKELDSYGETLSGQSKEEFLEAKPHLQALVALNLGENQNVTLNAAGHATFNNGEKTFSNVNVTLAPLYGKFCQ